MLKRIDAVDSEIGLSFDNVGYDRGGDPISRGVSFDLTNGDAIQVFGRNGAGKSSLLNVIAGVLKPCAGVIKWRSHSGASNDRPPPKSLLFAGHASPIKANFTVIENIMFWRRIYGGSKRFAELALHRIGLGECADLQAHALSAGQRKRLDFARALISDRLIWLLDEPTASLDDDGKMIVTAIIAEHLTTGGCAVIATHERLPISSDELVLEDA